MGGEAQAEREWVARTIEYPGHLIEAQRALAAVQAERRTYLATLPA
ncbi:hypothetical protein [Kitasatospora sp. NPDC127060]